MDLKKDEQKNGAVILDFREAYVRKQMHPKFRDLTDRIKKLKHSERAVQRMMEDIYNGHDSND